MLSVGRNAVLDTTSVSGRCTCSPAVWAPSQRWCNRPCPGLKAADVAHPATFHSSESQQQSPIGVFASSLTDSSQHSQQQQQQQRRQRQRRLFGGNTAQQNGGDAAEQQDRSRPSSSSSSPISSVAASIDEVLQERDNNELLSFGGQRAAGAGSSFASGASGSAPDRDNGSSSSSSSSFPARSISSSGSSSTGQLRRLLSPDYQQQLRQQPVHPQHAVLHQQQQQQPQPQLQLQTEQLRMQQQQLRSARTVQWYREQANKRLTVNIRKASDLPALRQLVRRYEGTMNHIHISALFVQLVKLVSSRSLRPLDMLALPAFLPQVLSLVTAAVPDFDERAISNVLHGIAVLELHQERELIAALLAAAETLGLSSFKPQGLANATWALATLHINPGARLTHQLLAASSAMMHKFKAVELAQLGWGIAVLRVRVSEPWLQTWRTAVAAAAESLTPQGTSMVLWATARMWEQQEHTAQQQLLLQQQQYASSSAAAAAAPAEWLAAVAACMKRKLKHYTPHSIGVCFWAMARLGYHPNAAFITKALQVVRPQLQGSTTPSDLALLMYSLAALKYRPSQSWLQGHAAAVRQKAGSLTVREVSNLLWAHARLNVLPADDKVMPKLMKRLYYGMQDANARDLANSLWALATLGQKPERSWMGIFGAQAEALVHDFAPQEVSNLLWSYAKLGLKPPHMLLVALWEGVGAGGSSSAADSSSSGSAMSFAGGAASRLSAFKASELSMLLWALATLRVQPGKLWWGQFLQASYHKMQAQTPQSLANIIWSLSEMQQQAPPAWLYHWAAATRGALDHMNAIDLGQVAAALQSPTFEPLGLPKLEALLLDVLDRLAATELQSGAYSKAAVELLMRMPQQIGISTGNMKDSYMAGAAAGSASDSVVQDLKQQLQVQQQQAAAVQVHIDAPELLKEDDFTTLAAVAAVGDGSDGAGQHC